MKKLLRVAVWFWFCLQFAMAELIQVPSDTEAKVNDSTYLNCSTSLPNKEIIWKHDAAFVYAGLVIDPYSSRFQVEKNSLNGSYNLVILSVKPTDSGTYFCQDDTGHGIQHMAQLSVLEGDPICHSDIVGDGVVGQNDCGIEPEELTLSCTVTYYGQTPVLEWRKDGESNPVNTGTKSEVSGSNVTHSLRMKGDLNLTNSVYFCQTTRSAGKQYSCDSGHIKVQYVFNNNVTVNKTMNEEVTCSANSSHSCSYKWYLGSKLVTDNQILKPKESGMYLCKAECLLRNKPCTVVALVVNVPSNDAGVSSYLTIIVVLVVILVICVIVVVIIIFIRQRTGKPVNKTTNVLKSEISDLPSITIQETKDPEAECLLREDSQLKAETEQNKEQLSSGKQSAQEQSPVIEKAKQTTAKQSNGIEEFPGKEQSTEKEKQITGKENVNEQPIAVKQGTEIERLTEKEPEIEKKQVDKVDVSSMSGPDAHQEQDHAKKGPVLFKEMTTDTKPGRITGIATSEETLYVAFENSSFLETFDLIVFNRKETRSIEGLINPQDIVFCRRNQYLYINDHKINNTNENEIIKYDPFRNKNTEKWPTGDCFGKLSVANDGNVILSVHDQNMLIEYEICGKVVRKIKLSYRVLPHHAIKLEDDQYLMIYESKKKTITSRVCLINERAVMSTQFDKEKLNETEALDDPKYLALGLDGSVLVLDGNRVLWITCALEYKQKFLPQLQLPVRMILDKSKGYLIFASNQGILQVYKLT